MLEPAGRNSELATCVHEAAHTVAGYKFGFDCKWVSVDFKYIKEHSDLESEETDDSLGMAMITSGKIIDDIAKRGMHSPHDKDVVLKYCIMHWAGPKAEAKFRGLPVDAYGSKGDRDASNGALRDCANDVEECRAMAQEVQRRSDAFVDENWHTITTFAELICRNKTITGPQIYSFLEGRFEAGSAL